MNIYDYFWWIKCRLYRNFIRIIYGNRFLFGRKLTFRNGFIVYIAKSGKLTIGDNCFFNNNCSINVLNKIQIGSFCIFGENVKIYDHNHSFFHKDIPIKKQEMKAESVTIGDNVWVGTNVVILAGSKIGNNCVIGAGNVINGIIEDNTLVRINGLKERIIYRD